MAGTGGRGGGEVRGIKGTGGRRDKEACLETDRGTRLIEGTRDFIAGSVNQSFIIGRFFRFGREETREIDTGLTYS